MRKRSLEGIYQATSEQIEDDSDEWRAKYLQDCTFVLQDLAWSWNLESITIHNLTVENLPTLGGPQIRVFFSPDPPSDQAEANHMSMCNKVRSIDMADMVCHLNGHDERVEFIGAGCPVCARAGIAGINNTVKPLSDVGRLPRFGLRTELEARMWESIPQEWLADTVRPYVKFTERETAESCQCCGKV